MILHIQDAKSPKQALDTLMKMYSTNTQVRKMQLKQELHNLQKYWKQLENKQEMKASRFMKWNNCIN
jgi:hypothetical protein